VFRLNIYGRNLHLNVQTLAVALGFHPQAYKAIHLEQHNKQYYIRIAKSSKNTSTSAASERIKMVINALSFAFAMVLGLNHYY